MKYTIDEIKHAVRVLKETCIEQKNDCCECPFWQVDDWGEHECILETEWPEYWDVDKIGVFGVRR